MNLHPEDILSIRTIIREELAHALARPAELLQAPAAPDLAAERFCSELTELEAATGLTRDILRAVKKTSKGQPDGPFRGHGAFPSDVRRWLDARQGFKAPTR